MGTVVLKNWAATTLGDVIESIIGGGTPSKREASNFEGHIPFMTVKDMCVRRPHDTIDHITKKALQNSSAKLIPADTLIIATRMGLGKIVRPVIDVAINQDLKAIVPTKALDKDFLEYWFLSQSNYLESKGTGTTVKGLRLELIRDLPFLLAPLNEQKRIVDKIEQLFSNLDEGEMLLKQVQKQLETYRQSVLKAAVTGEIIGVNGDEWPELKLGQLLTDIRYGTAKKCVNDPSKTPVLRIPNVAQGKIDLSNLKHTDFTETELKKLRLKAGDILLVRSNGSVSLVGLSAVVKERGVGCAYAGYLIRLRLKKDILPDYLNIYLHSPIVREKIEIQARSTSGVHNINSNEVKTISLRLPPINAQEDIVDKVDDIFSQIDALESWCASELARSSALRQSILKDAFSGKLVPQDPNDEPASELLKRIQAEKSKAAVKAPAKRGRKKKVTA
ncbi:MAG: restriction endonuclease subunit S [Desulfobulbaceae bacterium]|nr:restriction endonuclease subunit S [Desulfobulbaceae bacterium]